MQTTSSATLNELKKYAMQRNAGTNTEQKVLVFPSQANKVSGKQVYFLFSLYQMEDILTSADIQQVPFSPPFIEGITDWRGQVVPVISLERLLGLELENNTLSNRLAIVHSVNHDQGSSKKIWGMIHITRSMSMLALPLPCTPAEQPFPDKKNLIHGVYDWEKGLLVVLNMENILNGNLNLSGLHVQ